MRKGEKYEGRAPERHGPRAEVYRLATFGAKRCIACGGLKPFASFSTRSGGRYLKSTCKRCDSLQFKGHYETYKEFHLARARDYYAQWKPIRWQQVLDALGRACACCGEDEPSFLTVDHVNRDGHLEKKRGQRSRSSRALWTRIRNEGYPKTRYQILCYNCNLGRERDGSGICPHQRKPRAVSQGA